MSFKFSTVMQKSFGSHLNQYVAIALKIVSKVFGNIREKKYKKKMCYIWRNL